MTQKLRSFILAFLALSVSGMMDASCPSVPAGYSSSVRVDSLGVIFSVYYPASVQAGVNFDIYVCINNNTVGSQAPSLYSFLPVGISNSSITQTIGSDIPTTINNSDVSQNRNGTGLIQYPVGNQLQSLQQSYFVCVMNAATPGTYTYTPTWTEALGGGFIGQLPPIIINVITCPTITANNFTGCLTGSLTGALSGGTSPYTFFATGTQSPGSTVTVNSGGTYSFIPTGNTGISGNTGLTGSFQYQAKDASGCLSSIGTVQVRNPSLPTNPGIGTSFLYVASAGVPLTEPTNIFGGTPPYNYTLVGTAVNGNVTFNTGANTFTFTQATSPGASTFSYSVTDQNGCKAIDLTTSSTVENIYILSCQTGYTAAAALDADQTIFSICYPPVVRVGTDFSEIISIINLTNLTGTSEPIDYPLPDPTQGSAPGLSFISNTTPPAGTTFSSTAPTGDGGKGQFFAPISGVPPSTTYSVTATIGATATGTQSWTGNVPGNPALNLPITILVNSCPSITAATAAFSGCSNFVSGNLSPYVTGGTPPYTFAETGTLTCTGASLSPSGTISYTAPTGFTGPCQLQYSVTDSFGCTSPIGTVFLSPNQAATAVNGSGFTCENVPLSGTLAATGGVEPYTFAIVTNGTLGTAVITNPTTGAFTYTPLSNMFGTDTFTFHVTDPAGCVSNIATETITINENPIPTNTVVNDCVNGNVTGSLAGLVTGGRPPYTFSPTGSSIGGTVSISTGGNFSFTAATGFTGDGRFFYQATDSSGCIAIGIVGVNVASPSASGATGRLCSSATAGNLSNFVTGGFPPYTFTGNGPTTGGTVTINPSGTYSFTATPGFTGTASFGYLVTDSSNCTAANLINFNINLPIASNTAMSTCNATLIGNLSPLVSGGSGPYTFSGPVGAITCTGGSVTISSSGIYNFTAPNTGTTGPCSFVYQVTDANTCTSTGQVTIKPNTSPIANSILLFTCADTPLSDTVANSVSDGVPPLTFTKVGTEVGGTVVLNPNGTFVFTPTPGFLGDASFQYVVTDSSTPPCTSNVGTVTIAVELCCPAGPTGGFFAALVQAIP